jgi:hypothetical protein
LTPVDTNHRVVISIAAAPGWLTGTFKDATLVLAAGHLGLINPEAVKPHRVQRHFHGKISACAVGTVCQALLEGQINFDFIAAHHKFSTWHKGHFHLIFGANYPVT